LFNVAVSLTAMLHCATARGETGSLTVGASPVVFQGALFGLTTNSVISLTGSNTVSGSTRVTVNGEDAVLDAGASTWSKSQTLIPGFNRLEVRALDGNGKSLAETNEDLVLQVTSSSVSGPLASNTVWDSSMGVVRVTGSVVVPENGTLQIAEGTVLLVDAGAGVYATNASVTIRGTTRRPVFFLPADGTAVWGGINVSGTNGYLLLQHAEMMASHVQILNGTTGILEDSYLHDYTGNAPPIVSTFKPALLAMRRCHVARYYEVLSQMGLNQIEDCLVEFPSGDAIDFDAGKPGSFIRNCTIRHGDAVNVDGIDLGYAADLSPTDGVVVEGCVIYGFPFDKGVSIGEAATNIVVRNCVVYGVNVGIAVKDSSRATIYNNTVADADIALSLYQKGVTPGGGHGVAYNNIFWGLGTNILVDSLSTIAISHSDVDGAGYQGAGNLNSNPLFLNGGLHDYRLAANSPCLGSGTNGSNMGAAFPVGSVLVDTDEDGMPDRWEMI
jgi:parallel beta-helix repeat protein